jgi:hypothetical protein
MLPAKQCRMTDRSTPRTLRWFTRNVLAQALTNGFCAIPVVAGPCPHPDACLNCAHFRTDAGFLDVHKAELREPERGD